MHTAYQSTIYAYGHNPGTSYVDQLVLVGVTVVAATTAVVTGGGAAVAATVVAVIMQLCASCGGLCGTTSSQPLWQPQM